MYTKFLFLVVALFCFATHISAQNEYEVRKTGDDTILTVPSKKLGDIKISPELLNQHKASKALLTWKTGKVEVFKQQRWLYDVYGIHRQKQTNKTFLIIDANGWIQESNDEPIYGPWQFAWETILFGILAFVSGFLLISSWKKVTLSTILIYILLFFAGGAGGVTALAATAVAIGFAMAIVFAIAIGSVMGRLNGIAIMLMSINIGWFLCAGLNGQWALLPKILLLMLFGAIGAFIFGKGRLRKG
jgi:hypothetical protein